MPTNLPNTNMKVYNDTTDAQLSFKQYYDDLTGVTNSNTKTMDDIIGAPLSTLTTTSKTIVPAINENANQITVLSDDRGYLTTKVENDANLCVKNGKYQCNLNCPKDRGTYLVDTIQQTDTLLCQKAVCIYSESGDTQGNVYERCCIFGTWQHWVNKINVLNDETVNRKNGDALGYNDARGLVGDDLLPIYYTKNRKNGLCLQLFNNTQLGLPLSDNWSLYHVQTTLPFGDESALIIQKAISKSNEFIRTSKNNLEWEPWQELATTSKIEISSKLMNGWKVQDGCALTLVIAGKVATLEGIIINVGTSNNTIDLSQYKPSDGKWHGGNAIGNNQIARYFVINSDGIAMFQNGHESNVVYSINLTYPIG